MIWEMDRASFDRAYKGHSGQLYHSIKFLRRLGDDFYYIRTNHYRHHETEIKTGDLIRVPKEKDKRETVPPEIVTKIAHLKLKGEL